MRARAGGSPGFTLIELTVALVAGLIVAMGIVGLSRSATATFHEEVRTAAAEASLRTAIDRIRADLQRAGYMSTGNIQADTSIAKAPTDPNNVQNIDPSMAGILQLAAIHLADKGSVTQNFLALSAKQSPAVAPDYIEIGGNMTTADQFEVAVVQPLSGNCQRILLVPTSPAMYRLNAVGATAAPTELRNVFQPVPASLSTQFIVRLVDDAGHSQYLATCPELVTAGFTTLTGAPQPYPYVDIDATHTPIRTAQGTQTVSSLNGYAAGRAWINPVQIVRWEITGPGGTDAEPAQYVNALDNLPQQPTTADPNKYDLMRTFVDATGTLVAQTSEIVAEYAVDLDFAFTVDAGTDIQNPSLTTYGFDSTFNNVWAKNVAQFPSPTVGPQRIRAVRVRVATRAAQPDRTANVPVVNNASEEFLYRYCVIAPCPTPADRVLRWARVRTMTSEVRLPNLSRYYY
jgi:prepilin-type N-terminal cleavage/methylation domain-containing protein